MARNYRSRRNRGAGTGSNLPTPPNNNAGSGGANPPPPANTNTLAQTISLYLQGTDIMAKVYKLYLGLFIGIILLFASQFAAGAIDFNHGPGAMAMFELTMVLVILFVCFLPHILITGGVVSTAAAINNPDLLTDQAVIKFATFLVKGFLSICAYTIGIVFTVLLLFNIKNDYNGLAILIVVGTFIGICTVVIGDAGTLTPRLMRAGLVGFVVMTLLTYLPEVNGGSVIRDLLVTHNVLAGIATFVVIVAGTSNLGTFKDWSWSKLTWLLSVGNLLKLIGFVLFLFLIWWFFNIKAGNEIMSAKLDEIHSATTSTSDSSTGGLKSLFSTPEPIEVVFRLESLEGGILCGLPVGKHTITAEQTPLSVINKEDGQTYPVASIIGNTFGPPAENLPYHAKNYYWGILFNKKPSGSKILIKENGCINVMLNIEKEARVDWWTLNTPVDINITAQ